MKFSKALHWGSVITGFLGAFTAIGAWIAGGEGLFLGYSQGYLFTNAQVFILGSIAFGVGTLIHQNLEK